METTPQEPNPVAPQLSLPSEGAISDLLSHLGQVFGNTDLIRAAKNELSCIQDELLKSQLDYDEIFNAATAVLRDLKWEDEVCINPGGDGGGISVSYVEVSVSVSMSSRIAAEVANEIVRRLKGEY